MKWSQVARRLTPHRILMRPVSEHGGDVAQAPETAGRHHGLRN